MLQQTQARTVLPYYERFLSRFPDLESLARASEPEVLALWAGLGYYSRARNLLRAARQILDVHGSFPNDFSAILALPGIGRYTAGAICSIAFSQPYPIVDGNIRRVLTRVNGIRERVPESHYWALMSAWIPARDPSSFNQAMMELGATVCVPIQPRCSQCPIQTLCMAKKLGIETSIPGVRKKQAFRRIRIVLLVLEQNHQILLSAARPKDLIPGKWGLPWRSVENLESAGEIAGAMCREILGFTVPIERRALIRHSISNNRITGLGFYGSVASRKSELQAGNGFRWVNRSSADRFLTSSLFHKVLKGSILPLSGRENRY